MRCVVTRPRSYFKSNLTSLSPTVTHPHHPTVHNALHATPTLHPTAASAPYLNSLRLRNRHRCRPRPRTLPPHRASPLRYHLPLRLLHLSLLLAPVMAYRYLRHCDHWSGRHACQRAGFLEIPVTEKAPERLVETYPVHDVWLRGHWLQKVQLGCAEGAQALSAAGCARGSRTWRGRRTAC